MQICSNKIDRLGNNLSITQMNFGLLIYDFVYKKH